MGTCDILKESKKIQNLNTQNNKNTKKSNKGTMYYAAPIDKSNSIYGQPNNPSYSNATFSRDLSYTKPKMVKYCPKYADRSQRSLVKASLVELGQNSLMGNNTNNIGNSTTNLTLNNSIYCDTIIREENENTEDSELEVIHEGEVDENKIAKSNEQNIFHQYNYYVKNNDCAGMQL